MTIINRIISDPKEEKTADKVVMGCIKSKMKEGGQNRCEREEMEKERLRMRGVMKKAVEENEGLSNLQKAELTELLLRYEDVFSSKPGEFKGVECCLETYPHMPFRDKERIIPFNLRDAVKDNIKKLLKDGIIVKQSSEYNNALVIIRKKNGDVRVCLDARKLNNILIPGHDVPSHIDEVIRSFRGKIWLTSTDVTSGYFNVRLAPESRKYTAFTVQE